MRRPHRFHRNKTGRERAMALVVTLALLVLVTVLVFAFFTVSAANRTLQSSRASQIKAEILAQTAAEYVTDQFLREIVDNSTNVVTGGGTASVFLPLARANIVPQKLVAPAVAGSTNYPTLVRQSIVTADTNASTHATCEPARNSRVISLQRWNSPRLTLGSGFTSNAVPAWIYVSATNGPVATPSKGAVGRFAYNVYNTAGLLDVNAAGHPETLFVGTARPKDTLAGAALRQLNVSVAALVRMGQFRSPAEMSSKEAYMSNARAFASDGYLDTIATVTHNSTNRSYTNNFFYDRQDLIRFSRMLAPDLSLSNALPYLTTFSRARTGPTWEPSMNATNFPGYYSSAQAVTTHRYRDDAVKTNAVNPRLLTFVFESPTEIVHYCDDGTIEKDDPSQTSSYRLESGTPVVHRKFSLAKLAWLGQDGPNAAAFHSSLTATQRDKAIYDVFGLKWDVSGTFPKWVYDHGDPDRILPLNEVRLAGREPDFFELIKAVILEGSLGKHPGPGSGTDHDSTLTPVAGLRFDEIYQHADGQILQIGANIIDQADTDSYPTAITSEIPLRTFSSPEVFSLASREMFKTTMGVENIPYLLRVWNPILTKNGTMVRGWWWPEFWNPHRRPVSSSGLRPAAYRLRAFGFAKTEVQFDVPDTLYSGPEHNQSPETDYENDARNFVEFVDTNNFFDDPRRLQVDLDDFPGSTTDAMNKWNEIDYPNSAYKFLGIFTGEVTRPETVETTVQRLAPLKSSPANTCYFNPRSSFPVGRPPVTLVTEFRDEMGRWRPASMMARFNKIRRNTTTAVSGGVLTPGFSGVSVRGLVGKVDPRTERFASIGSEDDKWKMNKPMWKNVAPAETSGLAFYGPDVSMGFYLANGFDDRAEFGDLVRNDRSLKNFYSDPDGVVRPGDGARTILSSDDGNPLLLGTNTGSQSRRPVILDRPFLSVGELGAVFRDTPLRTIDFWTRDSADAGLLDVFSVRDEPLVTGGKINPNSAPNLVLRALLMDGAKHATDTAVPRFTQTETTAVANGLSAALNLEPLWNSSEYVTQFSDVIAASLNSSPSLKANKTLAEAPVRALSEISNFRTWTFLIDVVAQAGRFPGAGTTAVDFAVEGEKRVWVHVAIDRFTGEILGMQTESVYE